jgi:hypothetical protein
MGLDMYLRGKRFLSEYDEQDKPVSDELTAKFFTPEFDGSALAFRVQEVVAEVGYWRKANAIHKWFVDNVQDGEDDCGDYYVPEEKLTELRDICNKIIEDNSLANELLPPQAGFFFGNTDIDEWYIQSVVYTRDLMNKILESNELDRWTIYYHSSW